MGILSKKTSHLLQFLPSIFNPSVHFPKRHHCLKTTADNHKLLIKHYPAKISGRYAFSLLTPENFSSRDYDSFENRWLEGYLESAPSCNGLLYLYNKSDNAALWNPSTHDNIELPSHGKPDSTIVDSCAFGFDSKSQDYKMVRFVHNCIAEEEEEECSTFTSTTSVECYSFKSNSWKVLDDRDGVYDLYSPPVYVNGCFYWLCDKFILSFGFADETFSSIALPDIGKSLEGGSPHAFHLVEFDGSLGGIVNPRFGSITPYERTSKKLFELCVMDGHGSWTRELTLPLSGARSPMGFWGNRQLFFENEYRGGPILRYDLGTNNFMQLYITGHWGHMVFIPYV